MGMSDDVMVELPAAQLWLAVANVLEDTSPLEREARFVADEIIRLRDVGHLSKKIAGEIGSLIYQRRMHSAHFGDFRLTEPIRLLETEIDQSKHKGFAEFQVDPVQVPARIADIVAGPPCR